MEKTNTNTSDSPKLDRKTIERNRRIHMKALCFKLVSSIPFNYIQLTKQQKLPQQQQDQLDLAATYIKHMRERIEELKRKKEKALAILRPTQNNNNNNNMIFYGGTNLAVLEVRDLGSAIEVMLISGMNKNFMLYEVISVIEEEGAEVVTSNYSTVGDKIFYTLHAKVKISRVGVEISRVYERLQGLIAHH